MICRLTAMLTVAGALSLASGAQAAVTVLGNGLGQVCFETAELGGDASDGVAACTQALEQTAMPIRDHAATLVNRGILYSRLDKPELALNDYNDGLALNPGMGEGYVDRGATYIVLKRYDDALRDINKGIEMSTTRLQIAYYDRGVVREALGNIRGAYEDFKKAVEIEPNFTLAGEQLARFKVVRPQANGT
jgi:tetratricopeptide (TPR) repeat protein